MTRHLSIGLRQKQKGAALILGLLILAMTAVLSVTTMQTTIMEEKMSANQQDREKALLAAESAARYAWNTLDSSGGFDIAEFTNNASENGLYDLRSSNLLTTAGNKLAADWNAITSSAGAWPWNGTTERAAMPNNVASGDPMKLAAAPQFAIGLRAPVLRKGTENRKCIPFSVIGAGQGSLAASRALVELQVLPKSGCFRDLVN